MILFIAFLALSFYVLWKNKESSVSAVACGSYDLTGEIKFGEVAGIYDGTSVSVPEIALKDEPPLVLGVSTEERWVEVDLSEQKLRAWEGNTLYLETLVSTGLPWWPTPEGEYRVWIKLRATKMEGGSGKYYYYLPNVPYVMFFENDKIPGWRGFSLHGTYWHSDFGTPRSHGCVNLPTDVAEKLYYWISPILPEGKRVVRATPDNPGTKVVIHK